MTPDKTASIRSPLTNPLQGRNETLLSQFSLNVMNHNNIYADLQVSTSNVSPCPPPEAMLTFLTHL